MANTSVEGAVTPLDELARALRVVVRGGGRARLHEHLLDVAQIKLDRAAFGVLARIVELAPVRVSDLAHHGGVDVSTTSRQVARLEQDGMVRRVADPDDRRVCLLEATTEGRHAHAQMRAAWERTLGAILCGWPAGDSAIFTALLTRFGEDLTAYSERL